MKPYIYLLACVTLLFSGTAGWAQTTAPVQVTVKSLSIDDVTGVSYPFDIPFTISGPNPTNVVQIDFYYWLDDARAFSDQQKTLPKHWIVFKGDKDALTSTWTKSNADKGFALRCPGMHPNLDYKLKFKLYEELAMDAPSKQDLETKLAAVLVSFFKLTQDPKATYDVKALNVKLNEVFQKALSIDCKTQQLIDKCSKAAYTLDVDQNPDLKKEFAAFEGACRSLANDSTMLYGLNHDGDIKSVLTDYKNNHDLIVTELAALAQHQKDLEAPSLDFLKRVFCPQLPDFKTYTIQDGIDILKQILGAQDGLDNILNGKLRIFNNELEPTAQVAPDIESILFLGALFEKLAPATLTYKSDNTRGELTFPALSNIRNMAAMVRYFEQLDENHTKLALLTKNFPDLTVKVLEIQAITLDATSTADVTTEKSPYLSVEGGLGYAPNFQQAFSYFAANIYFFPVNKQEPVFAYHNLGYSLRKMLCLNIGLVNFFGDRPLNTVSYLGTGSSMDLMAGLGIRFNNFLKFNIDYLPFRTSNFNTLTGNPGTTGYIVYSVGVDINLLGGITSVAKGLKILN
jgi:hypothetical protein